MTGALVNASIAETPQQCSQQLVHRNPWIAATKTMTHDTHLNQYIEPDAAIKGTSM
jgi:hypothetical protein